MSTFCRMMYFFMSQLSLIILIRQRKHMLETYENLPARTCACTHTHTLFITTDVSLESGMLASEPGTHLLYIKQNKQFKRRKGHLFLRL